MYQFTADGTIMFLQSLVLGFKAFVQGLWTFIYRPFGFNGFTIPFTGITIAGFNFSIAGMLSGTLALTLLGTALVLHIIHLVNVVSG